MQVSRDEAHALVQARKRVRTVWAGEGLLLCPFPDGARYNYSHFVRECNRSMECNGDNCPWHHLPLQAKLHMPALVSIARYSWEAAKQLTLAIGAGYDPSRWLEKIVEITEGCFLIAEQEHPYGTLAVASRKPGRRNNPLEFRWLEDRTLKGFPEKLQLTCEQILPVVIKGQFRNAADVALDNSRDGRIKHKINPQTRQNPYIPQNTSNHQSLQDPSVESS